MSAFNTLETQLATDDTNGTSTSFRATFALAVRYLSTMNIKSDYPVDDLIMYNELKRQATNSSPTPLVPQGHIVNPKR